MRLIHQITSTIPKSLKTTVFAMCMVLLNGNSVAQQDHYDQLPDLGSGAQKFLTDYEAEQLGKSFIRQSRFRLPYVLSLIHI